MYEDIVENPFLCTMSNSTDVYKLTVCKNDYQLIANPNDDDEF